MMMLPDMAKTTEMVQLHYIQVFVDVCLRKGAFGVIFCSSKALTLTLYLLDRIESNLASLQGADEGPRWHRRQRNDRRRPQLLFQDDTLGSGSHDSDETLSLTRSDDSESTVVRTTTIATQTHTTFEDEEVEDDDSDGLGEDDFPLGPFAIASATAAAAALASTSSSAAAASAESESGTSRRRRSLCERLRGAVSRPLRAMVEQISTREDNEYAAYFSDHARRVLTSGKESWLSGSGEVGCESKGLARLNSSLLVSHHFHHSACMPLIFIIDILEIDFHTIRHLSLVEIFWSGMYCLRHFDC